MSDCDARIRPMAPVNDTEIGCEEEGDHVRHQGMLRDYAYPGSVTSLHWDEDDRRTFHGKWPGACDHRQDTDQGPATLGCILPLGHRGNHAT